MQEKEDSVKPFDEGQKTISTEIRKRTFYFLEGTGTLLWALLEVLRLFQVDIVLVLAVLAVLGNLSALVYAVLRLDRETVPLKPVIAYNLWITMISISVYAEYTESNSLFAIAKITGTAMMLLTVWQFAVNRNHTESLVAFMKVFRKFRIREPAGLSMADVLSLPDDQRRLFNWMVRQEDVGLREVSVFLKQSEAASHNTLADLVERGYLMKMESGGIIRYKVHLVTRRRREVPLKLWEALDEKGAKGK